MSRSKGFRNVVSTYECRETETKERMEYAMQGDVQRGTVDNESEVGGGTWGKIMCDTTVQGLTPEPLPSAQSPLHDNAPCVGLPNASWRA